MKLYTWYTEGYEILRDIFLATLKDGYEVVCPLVKMDVLPDRESYGGGSVYNAKKTELVLAAIEENFGASIMFTDVDLQFFKSTSEVVLTGIEHNDLVFQREFMEGKQRENNINLGFTAISCNEATRTFFEEVLSRVNDGNWDQEIVNRLLYQEQYDLRWELFPPEIWTLHCYFLDTRNVLLHHPVVSDLREKLKNMVEVRREVLPNDNVLFDILKRYRIDIDDVASHPFVVEP